jgi:hypothetical protein
MRLPVGLCVERSVDGIGPLVFSRRGAMFRIPPSPPPTRLILDDVQVFIGDAGHLRSHLHSYGGQIVMLIASEPTQERAQNPATPSS